jgi:hypothetical protein
MLCSVEVGVLPKFIIRLMIHSFLTASNSASYWRCMFQLPTASIWKSRRELQRLALVRVQILGMLGQLFPLYIPT